jgi:hypothetical protein
MAQRVLTIAAVLAFPATVAASFAVNVLAGLEELGVASAAIFLVPVAIYGAVVARAWALALPLLWSAALLGVLRVADLISGACSVCGSDEDWGNYPMFVLFLVVVPLTLTIAVGLYVGITLRDRRDARATPSGSASSGSDGTPPRSAGRRTATR